MAPARLAFYPEGTAFNGSTQRLNAISGGDTLSYRGLYEDERHGVPSATVCFVSNVPPELGAGGTDEASVALMDRLRVVECPSIPDDQKVVGFATLWKGTGGRVRRQALVTAILSRIEHMDGPPEPPQAVVAAAQAVADETAHEVVRAIGELTVKDETGWLQTDALTNAVNRHLDKEEKNSYRKSTVGRKAAEKFGSKSVVRQQQRGFDGYRLIDPKMGIRPDEAPITPRHEEAF